MFHEVYLLLRASWVCVFLAFPCAIGYTLVLHFLGRAIEAEKALDSVLTYSAEGPSMLLFVMSIVLGYGTLAILEERVVVSGPVRLAIAALWFAISIGGGFALACAIGDLPREAREMFLVCAVTALAAGVVRNFMLE